MPKKGKKGKAKGKVKKDDSEGDPGGVLSPEPIDKEALLQQELDQLTEELDQLKKQVESLRQENDWLQQEAHRVRVESHEYMSYMEKKTSKRQTTVISLSDQNQKEIADIQDQKRLMLEDYEQKKAALRAVLLEKGNLVAKAQQELEDLTEYKNLQREQLLRIKELEKEVMMMRGRHSDAIQQLKVRFLNEKREYQHDSELRISSMSKQANKEAKQCLESHTKSIKEQNRSLRHELLLLIRKTRALNEHRAHLEDQKRQLLMEQQYARDLKTLRSTRQHKVFKSFGMLEGEEETKENL